jgi:SHS family lactate transporter-like MFS transporter
MEALRLFRSLNRDQRNTFLACFLGWTLDAFDFFLLTFVLAPVAHDFGYSSLLGKKLEVHHVAIAITLTLMMRPIGAFIFGMLGDRYGRRIPLMVDIIFYSVMELATAFAPNFTVFLVLRALFGIGMGGEWGLGASLAMESLPNVARGLFSGFLQQGYAFGYLLGAVAYWMVFPTFGWRGLFIAGALPALLVVFIRARVPESPVWERRKSEKNFSGGEVSREFGLPAVIFLAAVAALIIGWMVVLAVVIALFVVLKLMLKPRHWGLFIHLALLMTAFNYMSHGTQDLYPTFLQHQRGFGVGGTAAMTIVYSLGAICGGMIIGSVSQHFGRRRAIIGCAICGMLLIPLWAFSPSTALLVVGGFLMQFMVQGAWGVVPVHLNEMSPEHYRGTFPALVYQLGNCAAAFAAQQQASLAEKIRDSNGKPNYGLTMAMVEVAVFLAVIILAAIGREERGREF